MKSVSFPLLGGLIFIFILGLMFSLILFYEPPSSDSTGITKIGSWTMVDLQSQQSIDSSQLRLPALFNVWASWCVSCRYEHGLLMELADTQIPIYGINYLDERPHALEWLQLRGDPYMLSLYDAKGSLGVILGIYGVPETFLIDEDGTILVRHIGVLTQEVWQTKFLPLWQAI